jgi:hypothetical protein
MSPTEAATATAGVCVAVGKLAKTWPAFPNAYIPTLVFAAGALIYPSLTEWSASNVIQGFMAGGFSTGAHQLYQQISGDVRRRAGNTEVIIKQ